MLYNDLWGKFNFYILLLLIILNATSLYVGITTYNTIYNNNKYIYNELDKINNYYYKKLKLYEEAEGKQ